MVALNNYGNDSSQWNLWKTFEGLDLADVMLIRLDLGLGKESGLEVLQYCIVHTVFTEDFRSHILLTSFPPPHLPHHSTTLLLPMSSQVPHPPTPPPDDTPSSSTSPSRIHALYTHTLLSSPHLPPPLAFLTTLHTHLTHTLTNTTSELLSLLSTSTSALLASLGPHSPEFTATRGAGELFGRFVVQTLNQGLPVSGGGKEDDDDFQPLRAHLLDSCEAFIDRATTSSTRIARKYAARFLDPDNYGNAKVMVATFAPDAAITNFFTTAATNLSSRNSAHDFVEHDVGPGLEIAVFTSSDPSPTTISTTTAAALIQTLSQHNIPHNHHPLTHLAPLFKNTTLLLLPATAILASGSIVGPRGIYTIGIVAKALGVKVFVVGEGWRCCRQFDVGELGLDEGKQGKGKRRRGGKSGKAEEKKEGRVMGVRGGKEEEREEDGHVDRHGEAEEQGEEVLPAEYVTGGLIMEEGVFGAGVVGEEVLRMWY